MQYSNHLLRELRSTIGHNIHRLRVERKLLLRDLAELSNIPEIMLDRFEIGKHELRLHELLRIACALRVEVREFI